MAERMIALCCAGAALIATASIAGAARAQTLTDPTRPPTTSAVDPSPAGTTNATHRLESVLISPARRIAVIDGVTVAVGAKVGEATLVRLTETEAVLRSGGDTEVLKLYPGIEKKPVKRASAAGGAKP